MTASLADEIAADLPSLLALHPSGPTVRDISSRLAADTANVRAAMAALDADGRGRMVRRHGEKAFRLVAADDPVLACRICHAEYERPRKSKRITCSKSCGVALSWRDPATKERRAAGIAAQRATPEGKANTVERNRARWARPGEREKLSERNRERWSDPIAAAETAAALKATNGLPGNREKARAARQAAWDDPAIRERNVAGIRRGKADPESRKRFSESLRQRWQDPAWRPKFLAASRANGRKGTAASVAARKARAEGPSPRAPAGQDDRDGGR